MTAPWLVGLDVDGTIILQDETMSPGVPEAVARLRDCLLYTSPSPRD